MLGNVRLSCADYRHELGDLSPKAGRRALVNPDDVGLIIGKTKLIVETAIERR
jgi:hypothetical protein